MSSEECNALIEAYNSEYKNQWEQSRYIAFVLAACNSDKITKPEDLLKFPWEHGEEIVITKEELQFREQEMLKWLNRV